MMSDNNRPIGGHVESLGWGVRPADDGGPLLPAVGRTLNWVPHRPADAVLRGLSPEARPVIVALAEAVTRLADGIARRAAAADRPAAPSAKSLFVADAFSNPSHTRFALKTTIAVMAAYINYTGLDWPGLRTSVTTCFFVALGSVGETIHKATLRIAGALLGGLAGGVCIVYLLPDMTDIGQLCLLMAAVSAVGAWVATSSDRLSYAGMQMAFAFFLSILQGYGPTTDLTEPRDRVVGILFGNVIMTIVFSVLWPTSAGDRARASVATALRTLAQLLTGDVRSKAGPRLAAVRALGEARRFVAISVFELGLLPAQAWHETIGGLSLDAFDRLAGAAFAVVNQVTGSDAGEVLHRQDEAVSAWLATCADRLAAAETVVGTPVDWPDLGETPAELPDEAPFSRRAAIEARRLLRSEIENAVAVRP